MIRRQYLVSRSKPERRGIATVWMIGLIGMVIALIGVIGEVGNLWLAKAELESACEAAALAGAQKWNETGGGDTLEARLRARALFHINLVLGVYHDIDLNYDAPSVNDNLSCDGELFFGGVPGGGAAPVVNAGRPPDCPQVDYGCHVRKTILVPSLWGNVFGISVGPYPVTCGVSAYTDCITGLTKLLRADDVVCP